MHRPHMARSDRASLRNQTMESLAASSTRTAIELFRPGPLAVGFVFFPLRSRQKRRFLPAETEADV